MKPTCNHNHRSKNYDNVHKIKKYVIIMITRAKDVIIMITRAKDVIIMITTAKDVIIITSANKIVNSEKKIF
jgi:hypothetical protein